MFLKMNKSNFWTQFVEKKSIVSLMNWVCPFVKIQSDLHGQLKISVLFHWFFSNLGVNTILGICRKLQSDLNLISLLLLFIYNYNSFTCFDIGYFMFLFNIFFCLLIIWYWIPYSNFVKIVYDSLLDNPLICILPLR